MPQILTTALLILLQITLSQSLVDDQTDASYLQDHRWLGEPR